MANVLKIRRGDGAPNNASISDYELVYDYTNNDLWTRHSGQVYKVAGGNVGTVTNVVAGNGLTGGGTVSATLDIGAGTGISVSANAIAVSGLTVSELAANSLQLSSESFADNNTSLMTSAAIADKIEAYGYSTVSGSINTSGSPVANDYARFTDANTVEGRSYAELKLDLNLGNLAYVDTLGTSHIPNLPASKITSGTLASARLDADTAHLSTTQTFTGAKTFSSLASFTMDGNTITGVDDSGEFTDDDSHIMTSAAIQDKILAYGYATSTGDITGVTAGTGLSGGGSSGTVTLNVDAAQTQITSVGTIGTGVWNGTAIASAYLDADTAHLSTTQTFSGAKTFQGDLSMDNGNATMLALKGTRWGYSSSYKALQIGATSGTYAIALGYDPSGNDYNGFQGDGREILFRRGIQFVTPNAADDSMYLYNLVMLDGKVGIGLVSPSQALEVTGHIKATNGYQFLGDSTSGVLSTGSWYGDLGSNGFERVAGLSHDGGEFVIVEKGGRVSTLVDGNYFAYESGNGTGGGFFSSTSSNYANAPGIRASAASELYVVQWDNGASDLTVSGMIKANGTGGFTIGNVAGVDRIQNVSNEFAFLTDGNAYADIQASNVNLAGELNFTSNANKYIDIYTLANSNSLTIRHHNPSGNVFEDALKLTANAGAKLFYNNALKFETTNTGATLTGALTATSFVGDGSNLTGVSGAVSAVANGSNNRIATFSSSTALYGESNLNFNGTTLAVTGSITTSGNATISGTASVTSSITTGYGVAFTNGNTNFLLYNNTNDNIFYMRDTTNGAMIQTWGVNLVQIHKGLIVNETGGNYDTRIEGDTDTDLLFVDASTDRVGISTNSPGNLFTVNSTTAYQASIQYDASTRLRISVESSGKARLYTDNNERVGIESGGFYVQPTNKIFLDGGLDTWLNEPTANTIGFGAGGAERMRMTTTGLGIGMTPNRPLNVNRSGDGNVARFSHSGSTGAVDIYTASTGGLINVRNDAGTATINIDARNDKIQLNDSIWLALGNSSDAALYHDDSNAYFRNWKGNLYITAETDDGDIVLSSDNGSGGTTAYLTLDGGLGYTTAQKNIRFDDNAKLQIGASADLDVWHDGTDSSIKNSTGDLYIMNYADDKDIIFRSDDGSGGVTAYLTLDGSGGLISIAKPTYIPDDTNLYFGSHSDFYMYYAGSSDEGFIRNATGDTVIYNTGNDTDIKFYTDDGSGGVTEYFRCDGSTGHLNLTPPNNVGIGTTSPASPLNVKSNSTSSSDSGITITQNGGSNAIFKMGEKSTDGGRFHMYDGGAEKIAFYTDGTANHISAGNVGIGTTVPGSLLTVYKDGTQVSGPSSSYQIMTVSNSNGGIAIQAGASSCGLLVFGDYGQYDAGRIRYDNATHYMQFCTQGNNPRMTLKNDGKIVVNGTDSDGMFRVNSTSAENAVKIYANAARGASRYALMIDDNDTNGRGSVYVENASGTGMKIVTQGSNYLLDLVSNNDGSNPARSCGVRMTSYEGRANGFYHQDANSSGHIWFSGNRYAGSTADWQVGYSSSGDTADYITKARILVDRDGNFHANEDVIAYSSTIGSDIKLKKNIEDIGYGLDDVLKMRAVEFDWKKKRQGKHDIGVIAQELEKIIPEVVNEVKTIGEGAENGDTHKVVDYAKLTSVLIKAIQQQQVQIDELKIQIGE